MITTTCMAENREEPVVIMTASRARPAGSRRRDGRGSCAVPAPPRPAPPGAALANLTALATTPVTRILYRPGTSRQLPAGSTSHPSVTPTTNDL
jgi:hypothetical protein